MRHFAQVILVQISLWTAATAAASPIDPTLLAAIQSPTRDAKLVARDAARHPAEELTFLGLKPNMTVVELWPGGGYWTEILGPYLKSQGHYYIALPPSVPADEQSISDRWRQRLQDHPERFGALELTLLGPNQYTIAPAGTADLVLTFRNIHNWMGANEAEAVLRAAFNALKPGGILGVEGHRGRTDQAQDPAAANGYVRQDYMIALARQAGFELVASSEILANPRDTKDWVDGVWTLPPTLSQGDIDRARYLAVGEADNFLLKFKKPKHRLGHHNSQ
jgi:predicted methyltransferase